MALFSMRVVRTAGAAVAVAVLVTLIGCKDPEFICHVGGTMRPVMEKLAKMYEEKTGMKVEVNSAGSGELLALIEEKSSGDVYVCHDPFLPSLMRRGLGVDGWTVAEIVPVVVVKKGNTKIKGLIDALQPGVRLVLTDYDYSTLGHILPTIFRKAGVDLEEIKKRAKTHRKGSQAANDVQAGVADAAIVWNAVAYLRRKDLDTIVIDKKHLPIPWSDADSITTATPRHEKHYLAPIRVTVATLKCSKQPAEAKKFAEFLVSDRATKVFRDYGYTMYKKVKLEYRDGRKVSQ